MATIWQPLPNRGLKAHNIGLNRYVIKTTNKAIESPIIGASSPINKA